MESAREDLEESEYERYISDQKQLLDELYLEYETTLNGRLDNIDALISDMIIEINNNSGLISETISEKTESVGYMMTGTMWSLLNSESPLVSTISNGVTSFTNAVTTAISSIGLEMQNMKNQYDALAEEYTKLAAESSAANSDEANSNNSTNTPTVNTPDNSPKDEPQKPKKEDKNSPKDEPQKPKKEDKKDISVGQTINAGNAPIYDHMGDATKETQYYKNDPNYIVLQEKNGWVQVRQEDLKNGVTGWFKLSDINGYATGKRKFSTNEIAWTQENGAEMIIRPSDGAILTPLAKGDSVLTANASKNIWDMANNPSDFIKDNLGIGSVNAPNNQNTHTNYTQYLDKVVFNMPNVKNYEEMLSAMKDDRNFENLISAMTTERMVGRSSLRKGKAIH